MTSSRSWSVPLIFFYLFSTLLIAGCGKPTLNTIKVEPAAATLTVGQLLQLRATGLDAKGQPIEGLNFTWSVVEDSGHIDASRDELAEAVNASPDEISEVMSELVRIGAVTRWYEKVPGLRGRGMVRYAMNPHVATKLPGAARVEAQKMHAPVRLVPAG